MIWKESGEMESCWKRENYKREKVQLESDLKEKGELVNINILC